MNSNLAIKAEGLSKNYFLKKEIPGVEGKPTAEFQALKNVSFEIKKGGLVGIIGPNGSGKSTLLKILSGVSRPTSGTVEIRGRVASVLDIGAGFNMELSGTENVFLNGQLLGFASHEIKSRYAEIIAFSGIGSFIEEPVKNYSNGMYLRLAFSILAHLDFDIYLFDEVMSVGDAAFVIKAKAKLKELTDTGKTIVMVSHNMAEMAHCSQVVELNNGAIVNSGFEKEILSKYILKSIERAELKVATSNVHLTEFEQYALSDNIKLLSVKFFQQENAAVSFSTSEPFFLEVVYQKLSATDTADLMFTFSTVHDVVILVSSPIFTGTVSTVKDPGTFTAWCRIPENFLSSNVYSVGLTFVKNTIVFKGLMPDAPLNLHLAGEFLNDYGVIASFPALFYFRANLILRNFANLSHLDLPAGMILPHFNWQVTENN